MGIIQDGKGRGNSMSVSSSLRGNVSGKVNPRIYYVSRDDGQAFSWYSSYSATSGDYVIHIKNTSQTRNLVISKILFSGVEAGKYSVETVTGTAAGTNITGAHMNRSKVREADCDSFGNAAVTGLTLDDTFASMRTLAGASAAGSSSNALILGVTGQVAVKYEGTTGIVDVTVFGYFESHDPELN